MTLPKRLSVRPHRAVRARRRGAARISSPANGPKTTERVSYHAQPQRPPALPSRFPFPGHLLTRLVSTAPVARIPPLTYLSPLNFPCIFLALIRGLSAESRPNHASVTLPQWTSVDPDVRCTALDHHGRVYTQPLRIPTDCCRDGRKNRTRLRSLLARPHNEATALPNRTGDALPVPTTCSEAVLSPY
ncbi:hypothetical protein GY45DRAFT_624396 [Cubamyces sp. BRFM 1775]|nr:hypothetical protein GY45DRAFT_624396 [Cubamyces sp. BRFM 1775]